VAVWTRDGWFVHAENPPQISSALGRLTLSRICVAATNV
jgi:hypothetical protein